MEQIETSKKGTNIKMEEKRLQYIDMVKGFSILLVVLGHILPSDSILMIWIYSFHVPIFFILVGWLSYKKKYKSIEMKQKINKEVKSLLYPYATFSIIFILYDILECAITGESANLIIKDIILTVS